MNDLPERLNQLAAKCEGGEDISGPESGSDLREAANAIETLLEQRDTLASIARKLSTMKSPPGPSMPGYSALALLAKRMRMMERVDEIAGEANEE